MREICCHECEKKIGVPDNLPGQRIRCPHCQTVNEIGELAAAPAPPTPHSSSPGMDNFAVETGESSVRSHFQRQRSSLPMIATGGLVLVAIIVTVAIVALNKSDEDQPKERSKAVAKSARKKSEEPAPEKRPERPESVQPPEIAPIADVEVKAGESVSLTIRATDTDGDNTSLRYSLQAGAPADAGIDPRTGAFRWTPGEAYAGQTVSLTVYVSEDGPTGLRGSQSFAIHIKPLAPIETLLSRFRSRWDRVELAGQPASAAFSGQGRILLVDGDQLVLYEYDAPAALKADSEQIDPDLATMFGQPQTWTSSTRMYKDNRWIAIYMGDDAATLNNLEAHFGLPFAKTSATNPVVTAPEPVEPAPPKPQVVNVLLELHEAGDLFKPAEYPRVRQAFAEQFADDQDAQIRAAWDEQYEALSTWLDEHPAIKEELYNAIQPADDTSRVLQIFRELWQKFPEHFEEYSNLAIATAVTWDNPRAVYDYSRHGRRTKSTLPDGLLDAAGNFGFFLEAEQFMQGRAKFLPWEFLLHLVNHKTPASERQWALAGYLPKRAMFGKCYSEVPYDHQMLETNSAVCKLGGKEYTLPNILQLGGVCAMQADYSARVGKSIGVPAAYVRGESIYGDLHAWVMWVELKSVTASSIGFSLESHGRYRGDKYYVGTLLEPQSGRRITDRQLELRLHTVGVNAEAKRHAELVMRTYPMLRDELNLDVAGQLDFLERVIKLCPWNEAAWKALAEISQTATLDVRQQKKMLSVAKSLFVTFARFPDFTWTIFDDLIAFERSPAKRHKLYGDLLVMYVAAQRPDLACEARLKLTDHLVADEQPLPAIQGLAATIMAFPDEGRYVPRMLDRLEGLCEGIEGANDELVKFYASFLPVIPQMRGNSPSKYCIEMFERGILKFKQAGQQQLALSYQAQLAKIRAGQGRK